MGRALLFRNGTVLTADPGHPVATAVVIDDGIIVALDDDALEHRARGAAEFDLAGGCLVPGFRDGHAHPLWGGIELGQVPLVGAKSLDDLLGRVRAYAQDHPELDWIEGGGYDPWLLPHGVGDATVLDKRGGRPTRGPRGERPPHDVGQLRGLASGRHRRQHP